MFEPPLELKLPEESATAALGRSLAHALQPPPRAPLVIYLSGALGAGKTSLARSLLRGLGVTGTVRSPTYTLLEIYEIGDLTVAHLDLYRLAEAGELEGLGLRELLEPGHVWLVEWPERGLGALPQADLTIGLELDGDGRRARIQAGTPAGKAVLASIAAAP